MEKGQQDLSESQEREASLQGKLEKARLELEHTKAKVANLQILSHACTMCSG